MIESIKRLNFWQGELPEVGHFRKVYVDKLLGCLNNSLMGTSKNPI
jgi:hypothetical protein